MATSLQRDVVASPTVASTVGDLQATIRSLVNERRQLRDRLGQGRNFGDGRRVGFKRGRAEFETGEAVGRGEEEDSEKRLRTNTTVTFTRASALDVPATAFPVEKRPNVQVDDPTVKRNRNLFGSLLGHLKKAKTVLDQEKNTRAAELHRTVEEQVSQKLDLERRNLAELRRRDVQERQRKDIARIREVQKELEMRENDMLSMSLQRHFNRMKSFIRTQATPMIFWVPNLHNDKTKELQLKTKEQIDKKLKSLMDKFAAENDIIQRTFRSQHSVENLNDDRLDIDESREAGASAKSSLKEIRGVHPDLINDSDEEADETSGPLHSTMKDEIDPNMSKDVEKRVGDESSDIKEELEKEIQVSNETNAVKEATSTET